MKIQIASDLHLEALAREREPGVVYRSAMDGRGRVIERGPGPSRPPDAVFRPVDGRDLLILAGDIGTDTLALAFVEQELERSPVIYVPGNHEYYSGRTREVIDAVWRALAMERPGLHYLTGEALTLDGVRFWGGPWYSDLWGITPHDRAGAWYHRDVAWGINDFYAGYGGAAWSVARHINHFHAQTDLLRAHAGALDVVITHWPPMKGAIHPKYDGDVLNPYFINDQDDLVREIGAKLWISGHTHEAYDYTVGETRCVGNPTGYSGEYHQSRLFRPDQVVEV